MVNSINFVVLGDQSIASELGKKGTVSDIAIYDRKTSDTIYTWAIPLTFPDKIQPLVQVVNMAEYAILNVTKLDRYLGEEIIALDYAGFKDGFILHSYEVDESKLRMLVRDTLSNFKFVDIEDLKRSIIALQPRSTQGPVLIYIDHAFDVKGVGTVVLGIVKQGRVKVYDELILEPSGKKVLVKSIQMHDDSVNEAGSPARVGLALKGISVDEISRGDMLCMPDTLKRSKAIDVAFTKSPFFKEELAENHTYMLSVGLQVKPVRIKHADMLQITSEKLIAYKPQQSCMLLKPDSQGSRIVGKGVMQ